MSRSRLLQLFDRMEAERQVLLRNLDVIAPERLEAQPPSGGWTVAQVITHLALAEEGALAYLNKKLDVKKHSPVGISSVWRLWLLNTAITLPLKYKAPAVAAEVPATSYAEARSRWDHVRLRMRAAYAAINEELIDHDLFKHPSLGRFSLPQGVRFMQRHARRHSGQIRRTVLALG